MSEDPLRQLIHQVNNLLTVIRMQVDAARALGTPASAHGALDLILRAAEHTEDEVRRFRQARPSDRGSGVAAPD